MIVVASWANILRLGQLASIQMSVLEENNNIVRFRRSWKRKVTSFGTASVLTMTLTSFEPFRCYCQGQTEKKSLSYQV